MDVSRRREDLVRHLRRRSNATAEDLAQELGVSVRTVFRDLEAMRSRGFAIDGTVGRGGGVQLDPTTVLLTTQLTTEEVMALLLSVALQRAAPWLPFATRAQEAVAKIERVLPAAGVRELRRMLQRVLIGEPAPAATLATVGRVDPDLLQVFERCFNGGRVMRFAYSDREGRRTRRRVEPHALLVRAPIWYIVGWDSLRDAPRTFRMDRIRSPLVDEATFMPRPPAAFDDLSVGARPLRPSTRLS
jgi:predicted DNA-binding transcriptional regulator YafY